MITLHIEHPISNYDTWRTAFDRFEPLRTAVMEYLVEEGVDCAVRRAAGASTGTVVVLSEADERTMLCDRGANALLSTVDIDTALRDAPDAVHLHLSGYTLFDEASREAGRYALAQWLSSAAGLAGRQVDRDHASVHVEPGAAGVAPGFH